MTILMVVMLLAQIGVAQHSSVHFTDHGHYGHNHDDHEKHDQNATENCQICLITKSLSFGLASDTTSITLPFIFGEELQKGGDLVFTAHHALLYNPRAPPSPLI